MKVVVYLFVAMIAVGSVLFGLDWYPAPMSPMPASQYALRAAVPPAPPATVVRVEPRLEVKPQAPAPVAPMVAAKPAPVPAPPPANVPDQQPPSIVALEPGTLAAAPPVAPSCNVEVCTAAYRSFVAADCTYQPAEGPRRLCTRGSPPPAAAPPPVAATVPDAARAQACNIAACSQSYPRSFSAADCTFQPADGPRRACTK